MKNISQVAEKLFNSQNISFIASVDEEGYPNIRAMLRPRKVEGAERILFSNNTSSGKVRHFLRDEKACVYVCDPASFQGLMLIGKMEVLETPEIKEMLWEEGDELYYPKGVTDPDYTVLRFTAWKGKYYSDLKSVAFEI